jgi:hypothetical protein
MPCRTRSEAALLGSPVIAAMVPPTSPPPEQPLLPQRAAVITYRRLWVARFAQPKLADRALQCRRSVGADRTGKQILTAHNATTGGARLRGRRRDYRARDIGEVLRADAGDGRVIECALFVGWVQSASIEMLHTPVIHLGFLEADGRAPSSASSSRRSGTLLRSDLRSSPFVDAWKACSSCARKGQRRYSSHQFNERK